MSEFTSKSEEKRVTTLMQEQIKKLQEELAAEKEKYELVGWFSGCENADGSAISLNKYEYGELAVALFREKP